MNTTILKSVITVLVALFSLNAFAYDVEIDGIYYNIVTKAKIAEVTSGDNKYTGEVTIPASILHDGVAYPVGSIGGHTFYNCSGLTSVTIPESVTSIGGSAFSGCSGLTSVTIPSSVTSIGGSAFYGCSGLTAVHITNVDAWCRISFSDNDTSNPLSKAHHLYLNGEEVKDLIIPSSVTSIGGSAFRGCSGLTSVTIPESVTSIGDRAFSDCSGLTSVTIPESVTSIGGFAFMYCSSLTSINIPNSVTSISGSAFYGCSGLTSVTIPNSVTSIGGTAFKNCSGLTSVTIPESVTSIGVRAFDGCSGLTAVHITDIDAWCKISFLANEYPSGVPLESNPLYYAHHLYLNGEEVKELIIPNSVTSIGPNTFSECSVLASVTIPSSVTSIGSSAFRGCSGLTSVTIPSSVTSIGSSAFFSCSGLTSVTIPSGVTSIGGYTFSNCSGLTSLTIPSSVTSIGDNAFYGCKDMTDLYCYAESAPSTGSSIFDGADVQYATLHVPAASIESYKSTAHWSRFGKIVALDDVPEPSPCATPTIAYNNGKLLFSCETEGAEFVSEITDEDIKKHYDSEVQLGVTYNISVVAIAAGYKNSDAATATLCWIETEPTNEDLPDGVTEVKAYPVLIQSKDGQIIVQGVADKAKVEVYTLTGVEAGNGIAANGSVTINTNMSNGEIAIVKIGDKSVKVLVK